MSGTHHWEDAVQKRMSPSSENKAKVLLSHTFFLACWNWAAVIILDWKSLTTVMVVASFVHISIIHFTADWCIVHSAWFVPLICCAGFMHKCCFCLSFKFCGQTCWHCWHEPSPHRCQQFVMKNCNGGLKTLKRRWCIDVKRRILGCHNP